MVIGDFFDEFHSGKSIESDKISSTGNYPVFGGNGIRGYTDTFNQDGDYVIIGRQGAYCGNVHYYSGKSYLTEHAIVGKTKKEYNHVSVAYLLSLLKLYKFQGQSAQPGLSVETLSKITVKHPQYNFYGMGQILSSLDAKIALNRRMNEELEGMAKMLYDYWFVQFDFPNEEGKPYKSSGGAMEYNAVLKREIPAGWKVEKLTKIADTYSGGTPNSTTAEYYQDGDIPWINSGEINHPIITKTDNYITELGMNNSSAKKIPAGAILVAMYGATAGKSSYLSFDATTNQAVCGVVPHKEYLLGYIQLYLSSLENYFSSISTGSARRNISQDLIRNTPIVIPSEKIISIFYQQHGPILRQRVSLQQEIEHLTVLRDKLLPLLMNGQVRVAD